MTNKLTEAMMEDAVVADSEGFLGESGLKLVARQYRVGSYIFDLLFEDRRGSKLIVELQLGTLDRSHTYKILDYYDEYKTSHPGDFIELMVVANRIPYERRQRLSALGVSWLEIPIEKFTALKKNSAEAETSFIGNNMQFRESGSSDMVNLQSQEIIFPIPRERNPIPMTDAPEVFKQFQKQSKLFLDALEKIEPPNKIDVDGRNVRPENPGNWFSGFSPIKWGRKIAIGQGSGYGNSIGVGYSINYIRNIHGDPFMRLLVGVENPFRKEYREEFKKEVSLAVATQKIPLPPRCRVWPNIRFEDFRIKGTYILECQPISLGEETWRNAINNYSILNGDFNDLMLQYIKKYHERGAFAVELKFD